MENMEYTKNKILREGICLAVIAIITFCFIGFTLARYVSNGTGADSARVAKWGIGMKIDKDINLFTDIYEDSITDTSYVKSSTTTEGKADKVLAPGMKNTIPYTITTFNGLPETAYKYSCNLIVDQDDERIKDTIYQLDNTPTFKWLFAKPGEEVIEYNTFSELQGAFNSMSKSYIAPNHSPFKNFPTGEVHVQLGYEWDAGDTSAQDEHDTGLGELSTKLPPEGLTKFTMTLNFNAEQVQEQKDFDIISVTLGNPPTGVTFVPDTSPIENIHRDAQYATVGNQFIIGDTESGEKTITANIDNKHHFKCWTINGSEVGTGQLVKNDEINVQVYTDAGLPTQNPENIPVYNGETKYPDWGDTANNFDIVDDERHPSKLDAINAGTYTVWFQPKTGFCWPDTGTFEPRPATWKIEKATRQLTFETPAFTNLVSGDISAGQVVSSPVMVSTNLEKSLPSDVYEFSLDDGASNNFVLGSVEGQKTECTVGPNILSAEGGAVTSVHVKVTDPTGNYKDIIVDSSTVEVNPFQFTIDYFTYKINSSNNSSNNADNPDEPGAVTVCQYIGPNNPTNKNTIDNNSNKQQDESVDNNPLTAQKAYADESSQTTSTNLDVPIHKAVHQDKDRPFNVVAIGVANTDIFGLRHCSSIKTDEDSVIKDVNENAFNTENVHDYLEKINLQCDKDSVIDRTVHQNAFNGCINLENVVLGDNVTLIDVGAFAGSARVAGNTESAYSNDEGGKYVLGTDASTYTDKVEQIPHTCYTIATEAFKGCSTLKKVVLNNSGETGKSVETHVNSYAFQNCDHLETYVVRGSNSNEMATKQIDDKVTYGTTPFIGAGTCANKTELSSLLIVGGAKTQAAKETNQTFYTYREIGSTDKKTEKTTLTTGSHYYYMIGDINNNGKTCTVSAVDNAIDLNGHEFNGGFSNATPDGYVFKLTDTKVGTSSYSYNHFRVDDTSVVHDTAATGYDPDTQTKKLGTITGGNNSNDTGGAFWANGYVDFVNGRVTGNTAKQGGAACVQNGGSVASGYERPYFRLYNGVLDKNTSTDEGGTYGGGAIMVKSNGAFFMYNGLIQNNKSTGPRGGAILTNSNGANRTGSSIVALYAGIIRNNYVNNTEPGGVCVLSFAGDMQGYVYADEKMVFDLENTSVTDQGTNIGCVGLYEYHWPTAEAPNSYTATFIKAKHSMNDQDYAINIPGKVFDTWVVDGIKENAFLNDGHVRKVVIDKANDQRFTVGADAFKNATRLETFVVKCAENTSDDKVSYTGNPFNGAGTRNYDSPTENMTAKLALAGGANTKGFAEDTVKCPGYNFRPVNSQTSSSSANPTADGQYTYLNTDLSYSKTQYLSIGYNSAVDLNGHKIKLTENSEDQVFKIKENINCRIDDSTTADYMNAGTIDGGVYDKDGKVTNKYGNSDGGECGSVCVIGTAEFVNGRIFNFNSYQGGGIGIYNSGTVRAFHLAIVGCESNDTRDEYGGGAVFCKNGGKLYMYDGKFDSNSSTARGGAINAYGGSSNLYIYGGQITNNSSTKEGGGIYCGDATTLINGGNISYNKSTKPDTSRHAGGGGLAIHKATVTMNGGTIAHNTAINSGGGVSVGIIDDGATSLGKLTMNDGTISDNTTDAMGGGVCLLSNKTASETCGGSMELNGGTISGNVAGGSTDKGQDDRGEGGGIMMSYRSTMTMKGGTISGNTARRAAFGGGGIGMRGGSNTNLYIYSGRITGNSAAIGAGIANRGDVYLYYNTSVSSTKLYIRENIKGSDKNAGLQKDPVHVDSGLVKGADGDYTVSG